ncbi:hypothetical protein LPJ70_004297, partial [Coemansia sp. RSA 2708]
NQMAALVAAADAQAASAQAIERIVEIETVQRQIERTIAALGFLRSYTDLPQKIGALVEARDFEHAWELVDSIDPDAQRQPMADGASIGVDADEIRRYREQIKAVVTDDLCRAIEAHDVEPAAQASRLLATHGHTEIVEAELLRLRARAGVVQLEQQGADIDGLLSTMANLVASERTFLEAVDFHAPDMLLEKLLAHYAEAIQPAIRGRVALGHESGDPHAALDLYQTLSGFYAELANALHTDTLTVGDNTAEPSRLLAQPIPQSLQLLFAPFVDYIGSLAASETARIRNGSLIVLQALEQEDGRAEAFVRAASQAMADVFADIEQALARVLAFVPPAIAADAVSTVLAAVQDVADFIEAGVATVAARAGFLIADLADATALDDPAHADLDGAAYQPLSSESKLEATSRAVVLTLLSELAKHHAEATLAVARRRWTQQTADNNAIDAPRELINAYLEGRETAASSQASVVPAELPRIDAVSEAIIHAARMASSSVLFLATGAFRPALRRVAQSSLWHGTAQTRSSMNIEVPQFSCSPSEDAVDIGEKIHVLLPELEQVDAMHAQYLRCVEPDLEPLYSCVLRFYSDFSDDTPMLAMLSLALRAVQRGFVRQICRVMPPLSALGCRQLAADAEYISSVAAAFVSTADSDFDVLLQCVLGRGQGQDDVEPLSELRTTLRALLEAGD